jgi:Flp pilus assembly protein TadG
VVELALVLPVLMLMAFGTFDYAFWIEKSIELQGAANSGAAYGAIPGNSTDHHGMTVVTNYNATGSLTGAAGFTATATDFYTCSPGGAQISSTGTCPSGDAFHYVQVTASQTSAVSVFYKFLPTSQALSATATLRVEAQQ